MRDDAFGPRGQVIRRAATVREELVPLLERLEAKLTANDDQKSHWRGAPVEHLRVRLVEELVELEEAWGRVGAYLGDSETIPEEIRTGSVVGDETLAARIQAVEDELLDVVAFALFQADVLSIIRGRLRRREVEP